MKNKLEVYRVLIVVALLLQAFIEVLFFSGAAFPDGAVELQKWQAFGAVTSYETAVFFYYSWVVTYFVGLIGMFLYWWPAKMIIIVNMVLLVVLCATNGIFIATAFESTLMSISNIFFIFSVGMAFFSPPVLVMFRKNRGVITEFA